jgi:phage tail tape-measure protein
MGKKRKDPPKAKATAAGKTHPVAVGLGSTTGAVGGAAVGSVAGPLGAGVGAVVGGLAGGLAGIAAGEAAAREEDDYEEAESDLRRGWEEGEGRDLEWERAKQAIRDAWHRVPRQEPRPSR